ncbi:murein biosynthesis integral membrane protein MurJ [Patescibacteria group bacterium]|nr:murein biosynthesis integral membrane protein MurJ [Patescibacteria group bacterium]
MISQLKGFFSNFTSNGSWLEKQQSSILSAAAVITIANVLSSLSGLIRERFLISEFFSTPSSQQAYEAFQVAFQIPDMMFQLIILGAVSAAFIPVFTQLKRDKDEATALKMSSTTMTILLLVFMLASMVVAYFAYPITLLRTGHAFTDAQVATTANLTQIMLIAQLFFAVSNFLTGMLQAYQRFIIPAIAPVLYNLGILIGVFLFSSKLGIYSAGVGVIIGAFIHMAIQLPLALKLGFRFKPSLSLSFPGVKQFFAMMPARLLTISITEFQNLSLGFFATSLGNLSFVVIRLALRLMTIPIRLFGVPIGQASLPFLSAQAGNKNLTSFTSLVTKSLHQIAFFAYPASVLLLILRIPFVRLIFGTHNFPWETTITTGKVVAIISISIGAQAMVQLLIRAFHALKDTRTPFFITLATTTFYLLGSWYFVFHSSSGVTGIAISTATAAFLELILCLLLLNYKLPQFVKSTLWMPQIKMLTASFFMAVFLYLPFKILDELVFNTTKTVELIGLTITTGTIGLLVYIYFSALFEVKELKLFANLITKFGPWRKSLEKTREVIVETSVEGDEI